MSRAPHIATLRVQPVLFHINISQRDQAPALCALPQGARIPHKLTLIQSPGSGCLPASQRVSEDILFVCMCVCVCVCVWLKEVPSTTGVATGPKFTQKCVAWGWEVLWPPLTVRVKFQPPPSPYPLSPGCSATYISHHDTCDDPHLLVRWQRFDGGEERTDHRVGQQGVKKQH